MHAATASTLNFQARIQNASGSLVADGSYSIQFKLYDAVSGGTNEWTETQSVTAKNGYISANLGAVTPFSSTIDWSQEKWLTMNINSDGEMNPRIKLTGVPFAFRAGLADKIAITGGSLLGDDILQKAPAGVQSVSSANSGLRFNQTGAGGLIQLQGNGLDVFTVSKAGDVSAAGNLAILGGSATFGTATQAGSLALSDGTSNTGTISTASLGANRTYTLPDASGTICLTTTCGGGLSFNQNGNTFGADGVLGTTDNFALRFITNNVEHMTILANGNVGVGDTTPTALFTVGTGDALQIDASGNLSTSGSISTTGALVFNSFGGSAGLLKVNGSGNVSVATSGTDYEVPLTFTNGLTRTGNNVQLGGTLTGNTTIDLSTYNLNLTNSGTLNIGTTSSPIAAKLNVNGTLLTTGVGYNTFAANTTLNAYGYFRSVDTSDAVSRFELGAYDFNGASQGGRALVLNPLGGNVGIGGDLTPDGLFSVGSTSQFQVNASGAVTAVGLNNGSGGITNAGAVSGVTTLSLSGAISGATATDTINGLIINAGALSGVTGITFTSGNLTLNSGSISGATTITGSGDINTTGGALQTNSTTRVDNSGNLTNIGTITAASGKFNVAANGSLTSAFTVLDGSTTATSGSGLGGGTINVVSTTNFDVGNYVLVNGTYAKITAKTGTSLTITPNLSWANGAAVTEYYIPEIGGGDTTSTLTNRFGRGYFISGVATGNGTTYYNENSIETSLTSFDLLNTNVTTLNFGGATTTLNIGSSGTTVNVLGNLATSGSQTITAGGGLVVSSGGINNNNGGITNAGSITGIGANLTGTGALTLASGGSGNLSLTAASGLVSLGASTIQTASGLSFDLANASNSTFTLQNSGAGVANLNLSDGELQIGGLSVITNGRVLQNVTANTSILTAGTLGTARGGTGLSSFTANGVLYASSTSALAQALGTSGQVMLVNGSGVPTFTTLSGDVTIDGTGLTTIGANTVALATDTTGNYVGTITTGNGLSVSGVGAENASAALSIVLPTSGTTATTSSNSGLELTSSGLSLFRGCNNGQVMEWNGTAWNCATDNTGFSDSRLKTNVTNVGSVLDSIKDVRVVTYNYDCLNGALSSLRLDCNNHTGIIAQEVANIFPSAVYQNAQGYYEVDFNVLNFMTMKGVVELANKINAAGDATLNSVSTGGSLRLTSAGVLQNITGLTATGTINLNHDALLSNTNINTGLSTGTITLGGGAAALVIDSTGLDVTSAGAVSGVTTLNMSGLATISGGASISGGTISLNAGGLLTNTNINTGASTGTVTIGGGSAALVINSTGLDVTSAGALSGITTLNMSGLATISGGASISGGTIDLNVGGLLANTNINTGASTGTVTIGGGSAALVINSTGLDVTSAGALSTPSTITAGSNILISGATADYQIVRGVTTYTGVDINCGSNQYLNTINVRGGIITSYSACSGVGLSDERLKTNVVSLDGNVLDRIKDVNVVSFDFICEDTYFSSTNTSCDSTRQTGVLAQQLATVFPELTYQDEHGYYHVKYDALAMYNFKATSELSKSIDSNKNATLNTVSTGGELRLSQTGALQNINGLTMTSGGASIVGGLNNNNGGITSVGSLSGVTGISAQSINLTAAGDDNLLTLTKDGNGVFTVFNSGALQLQLDSPQALAVKNAQGDNALTVDTLTGKVKIGSGNSGKTVLFVLDTKSTAGDPQGVNGAQYYNGDSNKMRCYEGNEWKDCIQTQYSEFTIMSMPTPWNQQPNNDSEFPTQSRTWITLRNTNKFRMVATLNAAGASNAVCRMQYATNTNSSTPDWHDLSSESGSELHLNQVGPLKSEWKSVANDAKNDVLVRIMCSGGDGQASPNFGNIRIQVY